MSDTRTSTDRAALMATLCVGSMIAHQVGGKATRDAYFLSSYSVTSLPTMLIVAAFVSIGVVLLTTRIMTRTGPFRLLPTAFTASALTLIAVRFAGGNAPRVTAVLVYLQIAAFGPILISAFWSAVNERFDPRTARQRIARIAAGGTVGGLIGGVLAERVAAWFGMQAMLLVLAALHLTCAFLVAELRPPAGSASPARGGSGSTREGLKLLGTFPYLRDLGLLVLVCTLAGVCLDYLFKVGATRAVTNADDLVRFFAAFYTGAALLTFLVQTLLTNRSLRVPKTGLTRTAGTLPMGMALGGLVTLVPGLIPAAAARMLESVLRSSMFRSSYELFYTPLSPEKKRASKSFIDVGFDRLGDAVGGGVIRLLLWTVPALALTTLSVLATLLGALGVLLVVRLHRGYERALASSLMSRAVELDLANITDGTTHTMVLNTLSGFQSEELQELRRQAAAGAPAEAEPAPGPPDADESSDPLLQRISELRSGDPQRVYRALDLSHAPTADVIPTIVQLLAWDEMAPHAIRSLSQAADTSCGQLVDLLLDPGQDFSIRRRVPRVLAHATQQRCVDGLLSGLRDRRFEVRYQCGRALARIHRKHPALEIQPPAVFEAVAREVKVDHRVWESQRLLDRLEDADDSPFVDDFLRTRSSRSLEHVFTVLSLALEQKPLLTAYKGLLTEDQNLKGTALEYLESVLPRSVRESLWPFLDDGAAHHGPPGDRQQILDQLISSHASIELHLDELRKRHQRGES